MADAYSAKQTQYQKAKDDQSVAEKKVHDAPPHLKQTAKDNALRLKTIAQTAKKALKGEWKYLAYLLIPGH